MKDLNTIIFSQVPSIQNFLENLFDELINRRSLIVILPPEISPDQIWILLREKLLARDFHLEEVQLSEFPVNSLPAIALSNFLNVTWQSQSIPRTVSNLLALEDLPDVIQLAGFDEISTQSQDDWISFLKQWAEANHTRANSGFLPTSIVLILQASNLLNIPKSNLYLAIHKWLRFPSALETHLVCRLVEPNSSQYITAKSQWREYILPSLAGNNPVLIDFLWDRLCADNDTILEQFEQYANQQQWFSDDLHSLGVGEVMNSGKNRRKMTALPAKWYQLWAKGLLIWTPEYGVELHPGALVILDRKDLVFHRLWRGQVNLLLPLIDRSRLFFCEHLTHSYGYDWPIRWYQPQTDEEYEAVRQNPLASQWGYLEWLVRNCVQLKKEKVWLPFLSIARQLRNEIAHYRPVEFKKFGQFWYEYERIEMLSV